MAVLILAAAVYYLVRGAGEAPPPPAAINGDDQEDAPRGPAAPLTPEQVAELVELKNVANGHLENEQLREADAALEQLAQALPEELLPARNLAVARVLGLEALSSDEGPSKSQFSSREEALEAAREAIEHLMAVSDQSPVPYWLLARVLIYERGQAGIQPAERQQQLAEIIATLQRAVQLAPDEIYLRYAIYREAALSPDDPELLQVAQQALEPAYQAQPANMALLRGLLELQAKRRDPAIVQTLEQARSAIAPLEAAQPQFKMGDLIQRAIDAAQQGNWQGVTTNVGFLSNLIKPTPRAKSDLRRIDPHPLTFVINEFPEQFYLQHPAAEPDEVGQPVAVSFVRLPEQLPAMTDARDVLLVDMDLSGSLDVVVLREAQVEIYVREAAQPSWRLLGSIEVPAGMTDLLAADLYVVDEPTRPRKITADPEAETVTCHDTYLGLIAYGPPGVAIIKNTGLEADEMQLGLEAVVQVESLTQLRDVNALLPADLDHDGDLDLVIASSSGLSLWANKNYMLFEDISSASELPPAELPVTDLVAVDWDRDVDLDIVVSAAAGEEIGLLENLLHQHFRWAPFDEDGANAAPIEALALMEVDGNISWDLARAGPGGLLLTRTNTPRPGEVVLIEHRPLSPTAYVGVKSWDYNNDGVLDLLCWSSERLDVYRGVEVDRQPADQSLYREYRTEPVEDLIEEPPQEVRSCIFEDLDGDGDLDLAFVTADGVVLLNNEGGNQNHWLRVRVRGKDDETVSGRVNHYAIGSLIEIKTGTRYQARVIDRPTMHFGLGAAERADVVRLVLTNGIPQVVVRPEPDQVICEPMVPKGSCPYVYTWTGERFEFFTDLLWSAPIGLQLAPGVMAPSRNWEFLKIPGEQLRPRDQHYELRITEELWEAGYFDLVELIAVDHPADVEVFTNEKVGPAEIAEPKIHAVRNRRLPVAARDPRENDVLEDVRQRDGIYMKGFERQFRQGLTEEHFLELDLGELQDPEQIILFLTGWIYPTDTSLNIALAQDPKLEGPRPPALWVPDSEGQWQEVMPYMGFPGGKTKTITVDLSNVFLTDDYRLRIVTSAQIYWDEAFFTVDEAPPEVRTMPLKLLTADLRYRGFSAAFPRHPNEPHTYNYDDVSRAPRWPPMEGKFTRYGDVLPLLLVEDDMMAVIGAGDEIALRFAPPEEELPAGWKRDFILHNIGWDKDADLNTVYGQTVEPLPFGAMHGYPYYPEQEYPDTPEHRAYLQQYQTREQDPASYWKQLQ